MERDGAGPGEAAAHEEQPQRRTAEEAEPADPGDRGDTEWYAVLGED